CHQRNADPKPSIANSPAKKFEHLLGSQPFGLSRCLHSIRHGNFAAGRGAQKERQKEKRGHYATAFCGAATSVVRGFVCPTSITPMQISATPTQRLGETLSCRKITARKVRTA